MIPRVLLLALGAAFVLAAVRFGDVRTPFCNDDAPVRMSAVAASSPSETVIDKKFGVKPGEHLEVRIGHSDLVIETGSSSEARVRVTLEGRNMERAREFFEHLNFTVEKRGTTVYVVTEPKGRWNWNSGGADIDVFITVPEVFDADVNTAHGDVEVAGLKGRLHFDTAHGDIEAGTLSGDMLEMRVAHGDVDVRRLGSEKIQIETSHGDLSIEEVVTAEIAVSAAHGDVDIEKLEGYPRIEAAHGDISVHMTKAQGGTFRNSHGDIDLRASGSAAADVDFSAEEIDIGSAYSFQGTQRRGRIEGRINGGGPAFDARTTHGRITLREN